MNLTQSGIPVLLIRPRNEIGAPYGNMETLDKLLSYPLYGSILVHLGATVEHGKEHGSGYPFVGIAWCFYLGTRQFDAYVNVTVSSGNRDKESKF